MSIASSSASSSGDSLEPTTFSYTHHDLDHPVSSLSVINKMRDNNQLCDVSLRIANSVTKAHRLVLASSSPYFHAMFNVDMAEKSQSEVELYDMDSGALQSLVKFMYTGRVLITEENVRTLLSASSFLQIDSVRDACCTFMIKQLRPTNCLGTRRFAETYSVDALSKQTYIYVLKNFEAVANFEEFLDLSYSEVENLVSEDKLRVSSEEQVYVAVIRWIKHDLAERSQYIVQLFGHVRMTQLSKQFLFNVVYKEPLVRNEASCIDMWLDALKYQDIPEERSDLPSKRTEQRLGGLGAFAIGGRCGATFYNSGERYDFVYDRWLPIAPMSECRASVGIASLDGLIYAVGGNYGNIGLSSAECYDPISNKWSSVKSMDSKRSHHGISVMDGFLYVCGGFDGSTWLSSVERYDQLTDIWSSCPSMTTPKSFCRVSVNNNCLYAIGGRRSGTNNNLFTMERYDPRTSKWMAMPDMNITRTGFSVATLDDTLYCVGGLGDSNKILSSGEMFNVRRNGWEPITNMQCARYRQSMVAVNGGLLVLGGYGEKTFGSALDSTEKYDPRNDQWSTAIPMATCRGGLGAALIYCSDLGSKLPPSSENTQQS